MHRHHQDAGIAGSGFLVDVRKQRELIDEPAERRFGISRFVFTGGRNELRKVFNATLGLLAALVTEVLQITTLVEYFSKRDRHRLAGGHLGQRANQIAKRRQGRDSARREQPPVDGMHEPDPQRIVHRHRLESGQKRRCVGSGRQIQRLERFHKPFADAPCGNVNDPSEADIVVRAQHQLQIRERVLDFLPLVKTNAADDLVGDACATQRVFQRARLRVGAVQHRHGVFHVVVKRRTRGACDEFCLVQVIPGAVVENLRAARALGVEPFVLAIAILRDDGGRRIKDDLRGAVVPLETHDMRLWKIVLEVENVAEVCAAPFVDRLVGVANHAEIPMLPCQALNQQILRAVGVLILVDHQEPELVAVAFADGFGLLEQLHSLQQEVVEVERIRLPQCLHVQRVQLADLLVARVPGS